MTPPDDDRRRRAEADRGRLASPRSLRRRRPAARRGRNISRCSATAAFGRTAGRRSPTTRRERPSTSDVWELYHLDQDFSETDDLAATQPEKLAELIETGGARPSAHRCCRWTTASRPRFAENAARVQQYVTERKARQEQGVLLLRWSGRNASGFRASAHGERDEREDRPEEPASRHRPYRQAGRDEHHRDAGLQHVPATTSLWPEPGEAHGLPKGGRNRESEPCPHRPEVAGAGQRPDHQQQRPDASGWRERHPPTSATAERFRGRRHSWPASSRGASTHDPSRARALPMRRPPASPRSPSSVNAAGSATPRTIVASIAIAAASPTPSCLNDDQRERREDREHGDHHDRGAGHGRAGARPAPRRPPRARSRRAWRASRPARGSAPCSPSTDRTGPRRRTAAASRRSRRTTGSPSSDWAQWCWNTASAPRTRRPTDSRFRPITDTASSGERNEQTSSTNASASTKAITSGVIVRHLVGEVEVAARRRRSAARSRRGAQLASPARASRAASSTLCGAR